MKRKFTLIELLIVVGTVALLLSMTVPLLKGAAASALTAHCSDNQNQIYTAQMSYSSDYNGFVIFTAGVGATYFRELSDKHYIDAADIAACPVSTQKSDRRYHVYGMYNAWENTYGKTKETLGDFRANGNRSMYYAVARLKKPAETVLSTESGKDRDQLLWNFLADGLMEGSAVLLMHEGKANVCFFDGGIAPKTAAELNASPLKLRRFFNPDGTSGDIK